MSPSREARRLKQKTATGWASSLNSYRPRLLMKISPIERNLFSNRLEVIIGKSISVRINDFFPLIKPSREGVQPTRISASFKKGKFDLAEKKPEETKGSKDMTLERPFFSNTIRLSSDNFFRYLDRFDFFIPSAGAISAAVALFPSRKSSISASRRVSFIVSKYITISI